MKYAIPAIKATIVVGVILCIALYATYGLNPQTTAPVDTPATPIFAAVPAPKAEAPLPHVVIDAVPQSTHANASLRGVVKSVQSYDAAGNASIYVGDTPVKIVGNHGSEPTWLHVEEGFPKLVGKTVWVLGRREQTNIIAWILVVEKTP